MKNPKVAVLCAGKGGINNAIYISSRPYLELNNKKGTPDVYLWNRTNNPRSAEKVEKLQSADLWQTKGIYDLELTGERMPKVTGDMGEAVEGADVVVISSPSNAHPQILKQLSKYAELDQITLIYCEGVGGRLGAEKILPDSIIVGTDTLPYACKVPTIDGKVVKGWIKAVKNRVFASTNYSDMKYVDNVMKQIVETDFKYSKDPLQPGLAHRTGFHVLGMIHSAERIMRKERFNFYMAFTPEATLAMEQLDKERQEVARAMGISPCPDIRNFLNYSYNVPLLEENGKPRNLYAMVHDEHTPYYGGPEKSLAPKNLEYRYLTEEVPMNIEPVRIFGEILGIETPMHNYVSRKSNELLGGKMPSSRTLEYMGLYEQDIINWPETRKKFYTRRNLIDMLPFKVRKYNLVGNWLKSKGDAINV